MCIGRRVRFAIDAYHLLAGGVRHACQNARLGHGRVAFVLEDPAYGNVFVPECLNQQAPGFIVPLTGSISGLQGAPVAGLTNQQTWAKYQVAIAGGISPTTQTRAGVVGFVQPA